MRIDYGDWKPALDMLIGRVEGGAWRHGIKTKDAIREVLRYGKFPADPSTMWSPRWRKKNGGILDFTLYYLVQSALKNRRWAFEGISGRRYRLRRIHCVEHGAAEGETDKDGKPVRPDKEGLWFRTEDMRRTDVLLVRRMYSGRETDSRPDKVFMAQADRALTDKSDELVVGDVLDEIAQAM